MGKLSENFKGLLGKWNGLSKTKKIAFGVIFSGIIVSLVFLGVSLGSTKYDVLFSNMDSADSAAVYKKLQEQKVKAKVEGNSILVPKDQVDTLRMQMLAEVPMTNGSQGFELLDKSKFGSTDAEMKINYQRAIQGELERTIKSFPEVENARVHIVLPDDTAFVKDTEPGSASVTLKVKTGQKLNDEQVKAIVALVTGAVKNIPKENVQVIDDKMTLLSKDLYNNENNKDIADSTTPAEKQQQLKSQYEKDVEKNLLNMLEAIYGKNKVKVKINADLDFDGVQQDSVTYDPKSVVVSEHGVKDSSTVPGTQANSPVDNNMTNSTVTNTNNGATTHEETTKNYNVSKVEQKTVKAPGAVKRLTASVALDGNVDDATKTSIRNLAVAAIGYDDKRGDTISVEGIPFDTSVSDDVKKDLDAMNKAEEQAKKTKMYAMIGIGAAVLLGSIIAIVLWRRRKNAEEEKLIEEQIQSKGIDVIIGDDTEETVKQQHKFKPIELDQENERTHVENEIKNYAKEKPDQVADIIKSWLAEDER